MRSFRGSWFFLLLLAEFASSSSDHPPLLGNCGDSASGEVTRYLQCPTATGSRIFKLELKPGNARHVILYLNFESPVNDTAVNSGGYDVYVSKFCIPSERTHDIKVVSPKTRNQIRIELTGESLANSNIFVGFFCKNKGCVDLPCDLAVGKGTLYGSTRTTEKVNVTATCTVPQLLSEDEIKNEVQCFKEDWRANMAWAVPLTFGIVILLTVIGYFYLKKKKEKEAAIHAELAQVDETPISDEGNDAKKKPVQMDKKPLNLVSVPVAMDTGRFIGDLKCDKSSDLKSLRHTLMVNFPDVPLRFSFLTKSDGEFIEVDPEDEDMMSAEDCGETVTLRQMKPDESCVSTGEEPVAPKIEKEGEKKEGEEGKDGEKKEGEAADKSRPTTADKSRPTSSASVHTNAEGEEEEIPIKKPKSYMSFTASRSIVLKTKFQRPIGAKIDITRLNDDGTNVVEYARSKNADPMMLWLKNQAKNGPRMSDEGPARRASNASIRSLHPSIPPSSPPPPPPDS